MAAMPSVGRIHKLWVLGIATAAVGANASTASAGHNVWLWACQGPAGQPLGGVAVQRAADSRDGCDEAGGVLRGELTAQDQAERRLRATVPPGTKLAKVTLQHTVGSGALYTVTAPTNPQQRYLGSTSAPPSTASRRSLTVSAPANLTGGESMTSRRLGEVRPQVRQPDRTPCAGRARFAHGRQVGLNVADDASRLGRGRRRAQPCVRLQLDPAIELRMFDVRANDSGSGLKRADIR